MLQDENEEFVNFSDDENAVTLSLDAFSISSQKSFQQDDGASPDINRHERENDSTVYDELASACSHQNIIGNTDYVKTDTVADIEHNEDNGFPYRDPFADNEGHKNVDSSGERGSQTSGIADENEDDFMSYESEDFEFESDRSEPSLTPLETNGSPSTDSNKPGSNKPDLSECAGNLQTENDTFTVTSTSKTEEAVNENENKLSSIGKDTTNCLQTKGDNLNKSETGSENKAIIPKCDCSDKGCSELHKTSSIQTFETTLSNKHRESNTGRTTTTFTQHPTTNISHNKDSKSKQSDSGKLTVMTKFPIKHELIYRKPQQRQLSRLDGHSAGKTSLDSTRSISDLPDIEAPPRRTGLQKNAEYPTPEQLRHNQSKAQAIQTSKRRSEKELELKKIYMTSNSDRLSNHLHARTRPHKCAARLDDKNHPNPPLLTRRSKTASASVRRRYLNTRSPKAEMRPRQRSHEEHNKPIVPEPHECCHGNNNQVKPLKKTSVCIKSDTTLKMTKPLNINDLHQQIYAINAKAMSQYEKSVEKPQESVLSIGTTNVCLDQIRQQPTSQSESESGRSHSTNTTLNEQYNKTNKTNYNASRNSIINKSVTHKHESLDRVASQNGKNLLKIEKGARHIEPLSSHATGRGHESNYTGNISTTGLLHGDYTSGNWNANERYGNETLSSGDNKQDPFYSHTQFLKSKGINIITEQDNLASTLNARSFVQGVPSGKHRLAPLASTVKCSSGNSKISTKPFRGDKKVRKVPDNYVKMSGKLRQRNSSGLADLARLRDIRRELLLTDTEVDDVFLTANVCTETVVIVQDIIRGILRKVCRHNSGYQPTELAQKRCTALDDSGEEVLCCILQVPQDTIDPSSFSCKVLDPLDVPRVTGKHERLISHIIRFTVTVIGQLTTERELVASIPIAHYMVEPWQEVIIKELDDAGRWTEGGEPSDIVSVDDNGKSVYGIQLLLKNLACIAVVARPKTDCLTLCDQPFTVTSSADPRVSMKVPATTQVEEVPKQVTLQVVPVDEAILNAFRQSRFQAQDIEITAASSLIAMSLTGQNPETISFVAKCVKTRREGGKTLEVNRSPSHKYADMKTSRDLNATLASRTCEYVPVSKFGLQSRNGTTFSSACSLSVSSTPTHSGTTKRQTTESDKRATMDMHLVQISEESEVRLKLLEDNERETSEHGRENTAKTSEHGRDNTVKTSEHGRENIVKTSDHCRENIVKTSEHGRENTVKFAVYDKSVRLLALETRSGLQYNKIQRLAQSFTDFVVTHNVTLKVGQDIRNVYSVCFSMTTCLPYKRDDRGAKKPTIFPNHLSTTLQIDDGDLVGIVFRGNIDVTNQTQRVYSFHGYRGINKIFDIQVGDSFSQRSLQSFHGGLKIFTLKGSRLGAVDKMEVPTLRANWELRAEFPLVLPKYLRKVPVCVNKAPVSLRFQDPLTVDFISKICTDLVEHWAQFAKALGISHARIQAIKQQNRNVVSERMLMDVVVCWMKQQPISRDKVAPLLQALNKCGKWKLAAELTQRNDSLSNHRSLAAKEKHLQKAFALICKSKHVTCKWQQIFRHLFREEKNEDQLKELVADIETKNENEVSRCYRALCLWKSEATSVPSLWKLVDALRYCHCEVAADSLTVIESKRT